jgi:hypothetical protein
MNITESADELGRDIFRALRVLWLKSAVLIREIRGESGMIAA